MTIELNVILIKIFNPKDFYLIKLKFYLKSKLQLNFLLKIQCDTFSDTF